VTLKPGEPRDICLFGDFGYNVPCDMADAARLTCLASRGRFPWLAQWHRLYLDGSAAPHCETAW